MARRKRGKVGEDKLFSEDQGVFMISVAAKLAGMHPQTLRIYEERGLIKPKRSPKQTRLYSQRDVARLKRIQQLTTEFGMNLAGVERVLALEEVMDAMRKRMDAMEREMLARINEVHRSYKRELVPWEPPGAALRREGDGKSFRIAVERPGSGSTTSEPRKRNAG